MLLEVPYPVISQCWGYKKVIWKKKANLYLGQIQFCMVNSPIAFIYSILFSSGPIQTIVILSWNTGCTWFRKCMSFFTARNLVLYIICDRFWDLSRWYGKCTFSLTVWWLTNIDNKYDVSVYTDGL